MLYRSTLFLSLLALAHGSQDFETLSEASTNISYPDIDDKFQGPKANLVKPHGGRIVYPNFDDLDDAESLTSKRFVVPKTVPSVQHANAVPKPAFRDVSRVSKEFSKPEPEDYTQRIKDLKKKPAVPKFEKKKQVIIEDDFEVIDYHRDPRGDRRIMDTEFSGYSVPEYLQDMNMAYYDHPEAIHDTLTKYGSDPVNCYVMKDFRKYFGSKSKKDLCEKFRYMQNIKKEGGNVWDFAELADSFDMKIRKGVVILRTSGEGEKRKRKVVVSFKGTTNLAEVKSDLSAGSKGFPEGRVESAHAGFVDHYYDLRPMLYEMLRRVAKYENISIQDLLKDVTTVGHSLGGAMANLFAADVYGTENIVVSMVTAASPKVFSYKDSLVLEPIFHKVYLNIKQRADPVPWFQGAVISDRDHIGTDITIPASPKHTVVHVLGGYIAVVDMMLESFIECAQFKVDKTSEAITPFGESDESLKKYAAAMRIVNDKKKAEEKLILTVTENVKANILEDEEFMRSFISAVQNKIGMPIPVA